MQYELLWKCFKSSPILDKVLHFSKVVVIIDKTPTFGPIEGHNLKIGVRGANNHTKISILTSTVYIGTGVVMMASVRKEGDVSKPI